MTGVMCAVAGSGSSQIASITAGSAASVVGFNRSAYGSTYPAEATLKELPITVLQDQLVADVFMIILEGTVDADFFTSVTVNGSTYLTSTAGFSHGVGTTQWDWPDPAGFVNTNTYQVTFA